MQFQEYFAQPEIWIEFEHGVHQRFISIKEAFYDFGESFCLSIPFFYAFCGCDATTSFYRKTGSFMFQAWMANREQAELSTAFQQLSWQPSLEVVETCMPVIERFVNYCYGYGGIQSINSVRFRIINTSVSKNLRELPPCFVSLKLHVLRSAFQSGWIWGNTVSNKQIPALTEWAGKWIIQIGW